MENKTKSDGGPTKYYDQPYKDWVTTNDQMEWLAELKWGKYAIHLKDIFKGLCRWDDKEQTNIEYDARKIVYYGVRVLKMIVGTKEMRVYLQSLLDDPQFSLESSQVGPSSKGVYDLEAMKFDPTTEDLGSMFTWRKAPQGGDFWCDAQCGNILKSVWEPLVQDMKDQYYKENH